MIRTILLAIVLVTVSATPALAYLGGPDVFELLGWSATEQRVYWLVHGLNDSGEGPAVYYAELGQGRPRTPVQLEWSRGGLDSSAVRRIDGLRRRLVPLLDEPGPRFPQNNVHVSTDTLGPVSRHRVTGEFQRGGYDFDVVTYCRPDVVLLHDYAIPGHDERFVVVGFVGIADYCEETQEAVVVKRGGAIPPLEYKGRW